jgi:ribosomal protein L40E
MNATRKHNSLRDLVHRTVRSAGIMAESEPREYKSYVCQRCDATISREETRDHARSCRDATFRPTGPDLRIEWPDLTNSLNGVVYDFTIVHGTAPSLRSAPLSDHFKRKDTSKHQLYDEQCRLNGEQLVVLCLSAHGVLSKETRAFAKRVAIAVDSTITEIVSAWSVLLQKRNGATAAQARLRFWPTHSG